MKTMFVLSLIISMFSCQKPLLEANTLNGNWGVNETTLFVSDTLKSTVSFSEITTYYDFNEQEGRVLISSDEEVEEYSFHYESNMAQLIINGEMIYNVEWLNAHELYLHREYGNNHSRYLLIKN